MPFSPSIPLFCATCQEEGHHFSDCMENNNQTFSPDQERCHFSPSPNNHSSSFVQEPNCTKCEAYDKFSKEQHDLMKTILSMRKQELESTSQSYLLQISTLEKDLEDSKLEYHKIECDFSELQTRCDSYLSKISELEKQDRKSVV